MKRFYQTQFAALLLGSVFCFEASAQSTLKHCGQKQAYEQLYATHPEIREADHQAELLPQPLNVQAAAPLYVIPVVFHVLHQNGPENISYEQIEDAVKGMNLAFRKLNADTANIVPAFKSLATDCQIEFRLARLDPNGKCTNGVDRIETTETNVGDDGSKLNQWPRNKYLNIWVVKQISSGAAGYAYYPGSTVAQPANDGIVILSNYVGSIGSGTPFTATALTHEVGHYLNLPHVWGNTNDPGVACGDDGVSDTPETKGYVSCDLSNANICNPSIEENVQNYMEYSYCSNMYTLGQRNRMWNTLNSSTAGRNNLWKLANLNATGTNDSVTVNCAPYAAFTPTSNYFICAGDSVTFTDKSYGSPTSRLWTTPGAVANSDTAKTIEVKYNTPGTYAVSVTATNAAGSNTITNPGAVVVMDNTAMFPPLSIDFENASFVDAKIKKTLSATDTVNWNITKMAGFNSTSSYKLTNARQAGGQIDAFVLPTLNLKNYSNVTVTFKVAYQMETAESNDVLKIYVSSNCGQSWAMRYSRAASSLAYDNTKFSTTTYIPQQSHWKSLSMPLPNSFLSENTIIKFEFNSGNGNNVYIDDINVNGVSPTGIEEQTLNSLVRMHPNPLTRGNSLTINFEQLVTVKSVEIYNAMGQLVDAETISGKPTQQLSLTSNSTWMQVPGIYFVKVNTSEGQSSQKIIVH